MVRGTLIVGDDDGNFWGGARAVRTRRDENVGESVSELSRNSYGGIICTAEVVTSPQELPAWRYGLTRSQVSPGTVLTVL